MNRSALPLVRGGAGGSAGAAGGARRSAAARRARRIGRAVVRHDLVPCEALGPEPGQGALEEGQGIGLAVTGPDLGVGQPRVVVDSHMDGRPAGARAALNAVAVDALAHLPEAPQLLGVQVQQLAGLGALVAHDGRPRRAGPPRVRILFRRRRVPRAPRCVTECRRIPGAAACCGHWAYWLRSCAVGWLCLAALGADAGSDTRPGTTPVGGR